jgi:glycosyltransferase involved in cell wall biosynthesis
MKIAVVGARGIPPQDLQSEVQHQPKTARQSLIPTDAATSGIEHYCAEVYPLIAKQGCTVDLYARSSYTARPWYSQYTDQGVRIISEPCLGIRGADALLSSASGALSTLSRQYDVVHFHALGPALFSILPRLASSSKVVVSCQGLDWQRAKWGKMSSRLILLGEQTAVRYAHEIIVVSQTLQDYFWKTYGRETVYIPNAPATYQSSDPSFQFGMSLGLEQNRYVIFLGRLVPEKSPDLLIKAFQALRPSGWKLAFVGKSSDTSAFTSDLMNLAVGDPDILFTGELSGGRLAEIVRGAGLYVSPSSLEGLPLSMLEAMQEGVPVLASDIPPHQQLVGEDRGVMFQTGDLNSAVHQMEWAIHHPQEMADCANRAQAYIRSHYQWDSIVSDTIKLYEFLVHERNGHQIRA